MLHEFIELEVLVSLALTRHMSVFSRGFNPITDARALAHARTHTYLLRSATPPVSAFPLVSSALPVSKVLLHCRRLPSPGLCTRASRCRTLRLGALLLQTNHGYNRDFDQVYRRVPTLRRAREVSSCRNAPCCLVVFFFFLFSPTPATLL